MKSLSLAALALVFALGSSALAANPTANAGPDQTVAATGTTASVTLDGSASTDPGGLTLTYTWAGGFTEGGGITTGAKPVVTFGVGVFNVLLVVDNGQGGLATDTVQITVTAPTTPTDTTPPVISSITADPATLWPPNHKYRLVTLSVSATDNSGVAPTCKITSVTSNEPSGAFHRGTPDFVITGDLTVELRAERLGGGTGRVYTITVQCTDASNNSATSTVTVTVAHDQGHGKGNKNGKGHSQSESSEGTF